MKLTDIRDALVTDGTAIGISGSRHIDLYADDVHVWVSGQTSPMTGHHHGRAALEGLLRAQEVVWPGFTYFAGNEYQA